MVSSRRPMLAQRLPRAQTTRKLLHHYPSHSLMLPNEKTTTSELYFVLLGLLANAVLV